MTREEAIYRLRGMQAANDGSFEDSVKEGLKADEPYAPGETMTFREFFKADHEAFDMAIKALEVANLEGYSSRLWKEAYERGKADAKPRWIPTSERLPEEDGDYFVTYEKGYAEDYNFPPIGIAGFDVDCESFGYWYEQFDRHTLGSLGSDWEEIKVIAWMPLPELYKGESEE